MQAPCFIDAPEAVREDSYELFRIMDTPGAPLSLAEAGWTSGQAEDALQLMLCSRLFDERALQLQRAGQLGTFSGASGQESVSAGAAIVADVSRDWIVPAYRELPGMLAWGYDLATHFRYFGGNPIGCEINPQAKVFPISIALGSQTPHAVGLAWAQKLSRSQGAIFCFFGDGAASEGDVHEAMNMAGALGVPVIFVLQNNGWAISTPTRVQTACKALAVRGLGYGLPNIRVDGTDILAVKAVMEAARKRAIEDSQAILIEAVTHRRGAHNTADAPEVYLEHYHSKETIQSWNLADPIDRFTAWLLSTGSLAQDDIERIRDESRRIVEDGWNQARGTPEPDVVDLVSHTYSAVTTKQLGQIERRHGGQA